MDGLLSTDTCGQLLVTRRCESRRHGAFAGDDWDNVYAPARESALFKGTSQVGLNHSYTGQETMCMCTTVPTTQATYISCLNPSVSSYHLVTHEDGATRLGRSTSAGRRRSTSCGTTEYQLPIGTQGRDRACELYTVIREEYHRVQGQARGYQAENSSLGHQSCQPCPVPCRSGVPPAGLLCPREAPLRPEAGSWGMIGTRLSHTPPAIPFLDITSSNETPKLPSAL